MNFFTSGFTLPSSSPIWALPLPMTPRKVGRVDSSIPLSQKWELVPDNGDDCSVLSEGVAEPAQTSCRAHLHLFPPRQSPSQWPEGRRPAWAPCRSWCSEGRGTWRCRATRDTQEVPRGEAGPQLPSHGDRCSQLRVGDACVCLCQGGRTAGGRQAGVTCQQHDLGAARTRGNVPRVCGPHLGAGWAGAGAGQSGASPSSVPSLCWLFQNKHCCVSFPRPRKKTLLRSQSF